MPESGDRRAADPLSDARIPPSIVVAVLQLAEQRGISTGPWFAGTGLTRGQLELPTTRISHRQATIILQRALKALPPGPVGMRVGGRDVLMTWGLVGFVMRSASSVTEALTIGLRLHQAAGSLLDLEIEHGSKEFVLRLTERSPNPEIFPFLCEEAWSSIVALIRAVFGRQFAPNRIEFAYPAPTYAESYRQYFQCPIRFDARQSQMWLESALLERTIPTSNPTQFAIALEAVRHLASPEDSRPDIVVAVEGALRENLRHPVTMAQAAEGLGMSERTLHRRLAEAETKFGEIRDRVRMQYATVLLRESDAPVTTIAAEVGFSDSRQFRRAYLRWTGRTPTAERKSAKGHTCINGG